MNWGHDRGTQQAKRQADFYKLLHSVYLSKVNT